MVESGKSTLNEDLQSVIDQALRSGMDAEAIGRMVAERALTLTEVARHGLVSETPPEDARDVIYEPGELPEGLIDLPSAAKKYGMPTSTLRHWIRVGKLHRRGRVRAPAAGGGYIVVAKSELEHARANPRKRGPKPRE